MRLSMLVVETKDGYGDYAGCNAYLWQKVTFFPLVLNLGDTLNIYVKAGSKPIDCIGAKLGNQYCVYRGYSQDKAGNWWALFQCKAKEVGRQPVIVYTFPNTKMNCCKQSQTVGYVQVYPNGAPPAEYKFKGGMIVPNTVNQGKKFYVGCDYNQYAFPALMAYYKGANEDVVCKWAGFWKDTTTYFECPTNGQPAGSYPVFCTTFASKQARSKPDYDKALVGNINVVPANQPLPPQANAPVVNIQQGQNLPMPSYETQIQPEVPVRNQQQTTPVPQIVNLDEEGNSNDNLIKYGVIGLGAAALLIVLMNRD